MRFISELSGSLKEVINTSFTKMSDVCFNKFRIFTNEVARFGGRLDELLNASSSEFDHLMRKGKYT